jgi:transcriptional regulator with XRE-family HTH domain
MSLFQTCQGVMLVNDTRNNLGSRFRLIRGSMKQIDFAKLVDVNRSYVAQVETNGNKPSIDYITKVAQKFNISIDWLLLGNVNNSDAYVLQSISENTQYAKNFIQELLKKLIEEKQEGILIEAIAALPKNSKINSDIVSELVEQDDDRILREMIEYLKTAWHCSDPKMKNWLEIQFQRCFPDYLEELQKKIIR